MIGILCDTIREGELIADALSLPITRVECFTPSTAARYRGARWSALIVASRDLLPGTHADAKKATGTPILWLDRVVVQMLKEAAGIRTKKPAPQKPTGAQPYDEPLPGV